MQRLHYTLRLCALRTIGLGILHNTLLRTLYNSFVYWFIWEACVSEDETWEIEISLWTCYSGRPSLCGRVIRELLLQQTNPSCEQQLKPNLPNPTNYPCQIRVQSRVTLLTVLESLSVCDKDIYCVPTPELARTSSVVFI